MRTLSPFFTVKSTLLPLSSIFPVPRATTLPSCGFSFAVSGIMMPPFFTSCSSIGCTSTRSPSGFTLTVAISCCLLLLLVFWFEPASSKHRFRSQPTNCLSISSCLRPRLRTPRRQRRHYHHRERLHLVQRR